MLRLYCFYTEGTPYEQEAMQCAESFGEFGATVRLVSDKRHENWMRNCLWRSVRLDELAQRFTGDAMGLLDADLLCLRQPEKLYSFSGDIGVCDGGVGRGRSMRFSAGVLVFGPGEHGRRALRRWALACRADKEKTVMLREQAYLHDVILEEAASGATVENFGVGYNRKIDDYVPGDGTVILHLVASRKLRRFVGGNP